MNQHSSIAPRSGIEPSPQPLTLSASDTPSGDAIPSRGQVEPRHPLFDQVWLMMVLPPLFWAGNAVIGRAAAGLVPPVGLAFWRWSLGAAIILPFAWRHLRADTRALAAHWKIVLLLAALGVGAFNTLLYQGLRTTTAMNGVMIQSIMPVLIVVLGVAIFRDRVKPLQWAGIFVSLVGATTLVTHGAPEALLHLAFNAGDIWILAAVVCYAAYTVLLRRRPSVHPLSFVAVTFTAGAGMLLPFYLWETASGWPMPVSVQALGSVAYTAICASILAYLCFNRAVQLAGPSVAGLSIHLLPVFGSLLAILLLGEEAHLYHAAGIGLIATGIVLATRLARQ